MNFFFWALMVLCVVIAVRIVWDICILIQDFRRKK